jgi:hypothetical protein
VYGGDELDRKDEDELRCWELGNLRDRCNGEAFFDARTFSLVSAFSENYLLPIPEYYSIVLIVMSLNNYESF